MNGTPQQVGAVIEDGKFVAGGSPEVEVALRLQEYSTSLTGKEQLAVHKFADEIDIVPKDACGNADHEIKEPT